MTLKKWISRSGSTTPKPSGGGKGPTPHPPQNPPKTTG